MSRNVQAYKCPADKYLSQAQKARGWTQRTRSLSMNAFMGPFNRNKNDTWAKGQNTFFTSYIQYLKLGDMRSPAMLYVMLDEHPDGINDGYFLSDPSPTASLGATFLPRITMVPPDFPSPMVIRRLKSGPIAPPNSRLRSPPLPLVIFPLRNVLIMIGLAKGLACSVENRIDRIRWICRMQPQV